MQTRPVTPGLLYQFVWCCSNVCISMAEFIFSMSDLIVIQAILRLLSACSETERILLQSPTAITF